MKRRRRVIIKIQFRISWGNKMIPINGIEINIDAVGSPTNRLKIVVKDYVILRRDTASTPIEHKSDIG